VFASVRHSATATRSAASGIHIHASCGVAAWSVLVRFAAYGSRLADRMSALRNEA
jgi:hypothetical protein